MIYTHIAAAIAASLAAWFWQENSYEAKLAAMQLAQSKAAFKQLEYASAETTRFQIRANKAEKTAATNAQILADARRSTAGELDGLRNELDTARRAVPEATCGAVREYANTLSALFDQCTTELERVAAAAQGHANDSKRLTDAWPSENVPQTNSDGQ